jgi:hypothetical protein
MHLQLLTSHKIDKQKWDECLNNSPNPFIYASSVCLDHMADNWDGIVGRDYEFIMPVAWRKKAGIKYCYDVPFIQQLGAFGNTLQQDELDACIKLMLRSFRYGNYPFNYFNHINNGKVCNNYMLSLASNYRSTSFFYSDKLKADLFKAAKNSLEYAKAGADEVIDLFRKLYAERIPNVSAKDYRNFYALCLLKEKENNLVVRKVSSTNKDDTLAINLLLKDKRRIYNLMSGTTTEGRSSLAGHFLYDNLIKEFSQTGLIFDFEGSDIPGVAHFYKSFGAINQPYTKLHFNRLPYFLRLLKR